MSKFKEGDKIKWLRRDSGIRVGTLGVVDKCTTDTTPWVIMDDGNMGTCRDSDIELVQTDWDN